ncbi:ABC transporter ATP-binding protein [Brumicola pallidula]|jgi:iron(III) transport system ATP-binding protein|uniref:Spermidine/putrescine import ATP-binding protein PotA n=1 Tax=Brumicola pallidula DSM 14239 = ACAM 615 TaxID=1121922 RepID=K6Y6K2_9ALTE|nr:ABC transporter ATP-binding protein [Glaciecola pallidula]GAC28409.1 spermidine/putrescine import ATP-binding protein PotA [Glaciecola pallidula DSM 14239 = ACAM 615]
MLDINNLSLSFGTQKVLQKLTISLQQGEIGCILGPSGCGKTTLLRAIAGFKSVQAGSISVNDIIVSDAGYKMPVAKRKIGVVFQDFALFPHMNVLKNVAYGLSKLSKSEALKLAQEAIELVGLNDAKSKYPHELSGGQQQRVAIARAIAPKPDLLLLDEPFSSLDPDLRERLSSEIRSIIKQQNITALLITHDQTEAFAMADKIGVLHHQQCQQWGTAYDLYHEPATEFIADFVGEGVFIPVQVVAYENDSESKIEASDDKLLWLETQLGRFLLPQEYIDNAAFKVGDIAKMLVRPDDLRHQDESVLKAKVVGRSFRGAHILYRLSLNQGEPLLCLAPSHHDHQIGESFGIHLEVEHVICFPY